MDDRGSSTAVLFTMPPQNRSNLVFTKAECKNNHFEAIVDTGAGISVISPEFCKFLKLVPKERWEGPKLLMANGAVITPEAFVSLEIFVEETPIYIEAAVLAINGYKVILGNDALRQLDVIKIEYERDGATIFSANPGTELDVQGENGEMGTIRSEESRVIPAYSIVTVTMEVDTKPSYTSKTRQMIEPTNKLLIDKGVSVGHLLLSNEELKDTVEIQVVNFSRVDQWLNKGTVLGSIFPVEVATETGGKKTP